jgi:hypothetical protein
VTARPLPAGCENFLYGFKAARRAARAAASASWPTLTLTLPLRPDQRRSAGAKDKARAAQHVASFTVHAGVVPAPAARLSGAGQNPVKAVCDRRATASVELPGERTREDGLEQDLSGPGDGSYREQGHEWPGP